MLMRWFLPIVFLLTFALPGLAQSNLIGVNISGNSPQIAFIDSTNGSFQNIVPVNAGILNVYSSALDPNGDIFYMLANTNGGPRLFTIDLAAGNIINQVNVPNVLHLAHLNFNCFDGLLYGLELDINNVNSVYLVTINTNNGILNRVSPAPINGFPDYSPSILQPATNQYIYVSSAQAGGNRNIYQIDLTTGLLTNSQSLSVPGLFRQLAYNCLSQEIFGLYHNPQLNRIILARVNENTGQLFPRASISGINGGAATEAVIDPYRDVYILSATDNSGTDLLFQLDLATGSPVTAPVIQSNAGFYQMKFDIPCFVEADFSFQNVCFGETTTFTDNSEAVTWNWNFDDPGSGANNTSNEISPNHIFSAPGSYEVTLIVNGCNESDTLTQTVVISNTVGTQLGADTTLCNQTNYTIDAGSSNGNYLWSDGSTNSTLTVNSSGDYWVEVSNGNCVLRDTVSITFSGIPLNLGADTNICFGDDLVLSVPNQPGLNYVWNNGSDTNSITVSDSGVYSLSVSDSVCFSTDTIDVGLLPSPVFNFPGVARICQGDSLQLDATTLNGTEYLWSTGDSVEAITVGLPGVYFALTSLAECTYSDTVEVFTDSLITSEVPAQVFYCEGREETVDFSDSQTATYQWSDGINSPIRAFSEPNVLTLTRSNGCGEVIDEVEIIEDECLCNVFIPNTFTPNGDGLNDTFAPKVNCPLLIFYRLEIYDRWGNVVFETEDPTAEWEYDNAPNDLNINLYNWKLTYDFFEKGDYDTKTEIGKVILMRH